MNVADIKKDSARVRNSSRNGLWSHDGWRIVAMSPIPLRRSR
jgi:hypothetical protein